MSGMKLGFAQTTDLLRKSTVAKFNGLSGKFEIEFCANAFCVRKNGMAEYSFQDDDQMPREGKFDGIRLELEDAQGFTCSFEFSAVEVDYLSNASGEVTGQSRLEVMDADLVKIPFENGPGVVLPYLTEILGVKHVQGNLEIAYQDSCWGTHSSDLDPEEKVRAYGNAAMEFLRGRVTGNVLLLPIDEGDQGRLIVRVAVPLDAISDQDHCKRKLRTLFGTSAYLVDVEQFGDSQVEAQLADDGTRQMT
ncbi:hypothetical protein [Paraburkholderia humisilvae]|uniref:Uncharacterized protein n=1 Tax=Paraburkholderia humisilvae TaxID=627669 RepID=A0A6J5DJN7_9BURK|nr:hypothetical protein [Paraburkholderia humisilvae]CAB3754389.1 hypothetical protein LMG29542_02337 [Paraburkholderia humisilvae]